MYLFRGERLEKELINKCRAGDAEAFGKVIQPYRRQLFSYLFRLSRNKMTAEDLFQETLIRVWKGFKSYNEQNKFSSWLFSIAHNVTIDLLRKPVSKFTDQPLESVIGKTNENEDNPHNTLVAKEVSELVMSAVNELPGRQKEVFLLRQHSGMTFKEIATVTNQPLNTVLGHMHYAVSKIRKKMSKEYE